MRIFLPISGENSDLFRPELVNEFLVFGIGERFERRRVPGALSGCQQPPNFFARDLGFAAAGRRSHQHIFELERGQRFELKWIWPKGSRLRRADAGKQLPQIAIVVSGRLRALPSCIFALIRRSPAFAI